MSYANTNQKRACIAILTWCKQTLGQEAWLAKRGSYRMGLECLPQALVLKTWSPKVVLLEGGGTFRKRGLVGPRPCPLPSCYFPAMRWIVLLCGMLPTMAVQHSHQGAKSNGSACSWIGTSKTMRQNETLSLFKLIISCILLRCQKANRRTINNEERVNSPGSYNNANSVWA